MSREAQTGPDAAPDPVVLRCEEVWGGNQKVDRRVGLPGLTAWVYSQPCDHTAAGGDVHYVSACAGGVLVRILVADVVGHGPAVADTADGLRLLMRRLVNDPDQRRLVNELNREFTSAAERTVSAGFSLQFATAVALTYDSLARQLWVVNAGHPPPLWFRAAERRWTTLEPADADAARNLPVGIDLDTDYQQFDLRLAAGDLVLCYTDSLIEACDAAGQLLGVDGLLSIVRSVATADPALVVPAVVRALGELNGRNLTQDDLTCLLMLATE